MGTPDSTSFTNEHHAEWPDEKPLAVGRARGAPLDRHGPDEPHHLDGHRRAGLSREDAADHEPGVREQFASATTVSFEVRR
jgi:hypothetical protein